MILSYSADAGGQVQLQMLLQELPIACPCGMRHFHRHGGYWRSIAQVWVQRLICVLCRATISLVPDSCVPFKHHPTEVISKGIDGQMQGRSARECQNDVHPSTASRWLQEFAKHASILATEGASRLNIPPVSGSPQQIYQHLFRAFLSGLITDFFSNLQVLLSRKRPAIGIFRVLMP